MHLTKDKKFWVNDDDYYRRWGANYEQKQFDSTMKHISERGVALDCGSHVGIWTKRLSYLFDTVIAFEPIPKHIECHKKNCTESNITLNECALSNKETTMDMKMTIGWNTGKSTLEYKSNLVKGDNDIIQIQTKTLDSFKLPKVDFMKIDVEKHEVKLLNGAIETLMRCKPIIYIEDHNYFYGRKVPNGVELLYSLGYEVIGYLGSYNYLLKPQVKFK
jgi:FkbM family methyltransferase